MTTIEEFYNELYDGITELVNNGISKALEENKAAGMNAKEFHDKMLEISKNGDQECKHVEADELMCELLIDLGYKDGVTVFENMDKWYS